MKVKKKNLAIITGVNGFTSWYLIDLLKKRKKTYKIAGIDIHSDPKNDVDIYLKSRLKKDLPVFMEKELKKAEKVICFHLAGIIFERDLGRLMDNNITASNHLFASLLPYSEKTTVINVGSSAEYGFHGNKSIKESAEPYPVSAYGFSKLLQTRLAESYFRIHSLPVIMTRTFNIIGPGQTDKLACGRMVKQALAYKSGRIKEFSVRNLSSYRDLMDVRDAVKAYLSLCDNGKPGQIYNIGTGKAVKMEKVLEKVFSGVGIEPEIVRNDSPAARQDVSYQKAGIQKIKKATGWKPVITLEKSIKDMIMFRG